MTCYHHKPRNKHKHAKETVLECEMIDCPQSLTTNIEDHKLNPATIVDTHAANETHKSSKSEWNTTVNLPVKNVLFERKCLTTVTVEG